jgi:hypothetical protein
MRSWGANEEMKMELNITERQALQLMANAVNASIPMGMGYLQHEEKEYTADDMRAEMDAKGGIDFDYFRGRMVKTGIEKTATGYRLSDGKPHSSYQSWARKYPTYQALADSVLEPATV